MATMGDNLRAQAAGTLQTGYAAGAIPPAVEFTGRWARAAKGDFVFLALFLAGLVAHLGLGFYMVAEQNVRLEDGQITLSESLQQEISDCIGGPGRRALTAEEHMRRLADADNCRDLWCVLNQSLAVPIVTTLMVPVIGLFWMLSMYAFPRVMVWGSMLVGIVLYVLLGIALIIEGVPDAGGVFLALCGINVIVLFVVRGAVNKAAGHVRAAMSALSYNKDVFAAAFFLEALMLLFLGLTWHFAITGSQVLQVDEFCELRVRDEMQSMWAYQFIYLFWFVSFCDMGKLVVTAMAVGGWYFETRPNGSAMPPAFLALRSAVTTSSGTLAAGSLIAGFFDYLVEKTSSRYWWLDPALIILKCVLVLLQSCVQALTRFAMVAHAFTGEGFFNSAGRMFKIMERNFIGAYVTDRVAVSVVGVGARSVSLAIGCLAWFWIDRDNGWTTLQDMTGPDSVFGGLIGFLGFVFLFLYLLRRPLLSLLLIGLIAGGTGIDWGTAQIFAPIGGIFIACLSTIILEFQGSVMLNAIDTMFVCYAIGKESGMGKPMTGGRDLVYVMMEDIPEAKQVHMVPQ